MGRYCHLSRALIIFLAFVSHKLMNSGAEQCSRPDLLVICGADYGAPNLSSAICSLGDLGQVTFCASVAKGMMTLCACWEDGRALHMAWYPLPMCRKGLRNFSPHRGLSLAIKHGVRDIATTPYTSTIRNKTARMYIKQRQP